MTSTSIEIRIPAAIAALPQEDALEKYIEKSGG